MNKRTNGWINGFIGVLIFSGSLPATRLAVSDFDPLFLTVRRAAIAGVLAGGLLLIFRQQHPAKRDLISLLVVAFGVVIGFPLLTALALQHVTSAHAIVFIGLLPLATAVFRRTARGERPARLLDFLSCRQLVSSRFRPHSGEVHPRLATRTCWLLLSYAVLVMQKGQGFHGVWGIGR